jgi:hypothetical protein
MSILIAGSQAQRVWNCDVAASVGGPAVVFAAKESNARMIPGDVPEHQ